MIIDHESLGLSPPLPGDVAAPDPLGEEGLPSVFGLLQGIEQPARLGDWRQLLRLDAPPASQLPIGPPPAPAAMEAMAAASRRLLLRRLIRRHAHWLMGDAGSVAEPSEEGEGNAIAAMLALLANYQDLEDAIVARQLTESQE